MSRRPEDDALDRLAQLAAYVPPRYFQETRSLIDTVRSALELRQEIAWGYQEESDRLQEEVERLRDLVRGGNCIRGEDGMSPCEQLREERDDVGQAALREARRCTDFRLRWEQREREWVIEHDRAEAAEAEVRQLREAQSSLLAEKVRLTEGLREIADSGVPGREFRSPLAFVIHLQGKARALLAGSPSETVSATPRTDSAPDRPPPWKCLEPNLPDGGGAK